MAENLNAVRSIRTNSGVYVNVFETDPDTIKIEDIAHALSQQSRFGGHLPEFYSVAQHSVMCCMSANDENKYNALMHDVSEAYLLDIPKPIKLELPDYNLVEHRLMKVLSQKFGFEYPKNEEVERVDILLLEWEWTAIMLNQPTEKYPKFVCLTPSEAKAAFLEAFYFETKRRQIVIS